jgi:3-oxoacyl-[acyl-carrier protein] reductase
VDYGLDGRVAVVSGASRGIGRAIAGVLGAEGAAVVLAGRTADDLDAAAAELDRIAPGRVLAVRADMTDRDDVGRVVDAARDRFGPVTIAISNVIGHVIDAAREGTGPGAGSFDTIRTADYEQEFRQLFVSAWTLARACVPDMRTAGWGRICNIGSGVAREPATQLPHLLPNVVRPAVAGLHRLLAARLAPDGITVNNILTGSILTERNRAYWSWLAQERNTGVAEVSRAMTDTIPAGRMGEPHELAALVAFLCSAQAGRITGQSIPVVGGGSRHL